MRELWEEGVWDMCGCGCGRGGEGVFDLLWGEEEIWEWAGTGAGAWDGGEALGWGDWVDALIFGLEEVGGYGVQFCER